LNLLLDTHIVIWSASEPSRLPADVALELENPANSLWYSPVSVWETCLLAEKERIVIEGSPAESVRRIYQALPLREAALNTEVALQSRAVKLPHQDPADRFIAATAMVYELILVTADQRILGARELQLLDASS
jgi:PIN domain nuclease of toxin-antitoxin system|tara:strand:+ start:784 stop:1182 length:399 start_codon:yes stop_codon:yes gene_type:complete